jgi:hypothetical protein
MIINCVHKHYTNEMENLWMKYKHYGELTRLQIDSNSERTTILF